MEMENILSEIADALPKQFDFYHLGHIELRKVEFFDLDPSAIAFRVYGDRSATVIILFEKGLDSSVYSEFGNLVVSQMVERLHAEKGLDIHISPPLPISSTRLEQLTQGIQLLRRTYVHLYKNSVIPIETLILPLAVEESGNA